MTLFTFQCSSSLWQTAVPQTSITFVSKASVDTGTVQGYNLRKRVEVVKNCRNIGKKNMKYNELMPKMKVNPETYVSTLVFIHERRFNAQDCKYRSSKQTEIYAKQTLPQNCHWHRCPMFIEGLDRAPVAVADTKH